MGWINDLFEKHKLVRRLLVLWAIVLITWVVVVTFSDISLISAPGATALSVVVGILGTAVAFYQWSRSRDDHKDE